MITPEQQSQIDSYLKTSGYTSPTQTTAPSWYDAVQTKATQTKQAAEAKSGGIKVGDTTYSLKNDINYAKEKGQESIKTAVSKVGEDVGRFKAGETTLGTKNPVTKALSAGETAFQTVGHSLTPIPEAIGHAPVFRELNDMIQSGSKHAADAAQYLWSKILPSAKDNPEAYQKIKDHLEADFNKNPGKYKAMAADMESAMGILNTAALGLVKGSGEDLNFGSDVVKPAVEAGKKAAGAAEAVKANLADAAKETAVKKTPEMVGKITQAKPENIPAATRALSNVDTQGVKTFKDLSGRFDTKIKENLKNVDTAFSKSTDTFTPDKLTKEFTSGDIKVNHNFVDDAIAHLKELYGKTNEPKALADISNLDARYKETGLTPKEINDLARQYGNEFGKKAFGKNGELKTSVNSGAYENTRTGIKETARDLMPDEDTRSLDKQTADMIKTKDMVDKMDSKAKMLEQKLQKAGLLQKVGLAIGKGVDIVSGGLIKGFLKTITGIGKEAGKVLDPIQLQKNLEANLKTLDKLNEMNANDAAKELRTMKSP